MRGTWVGSLGGKIPQEEETSTHSSILASESPWTRPGGLQSTGVSKKKWTRLSDETTTTENYSAPTGLPEELTWLEQDS